MGDLQHKLSKKIAQLTKVIYHLNTKNEDNDSIIKVMNEQHENEIKDVLNDAAEKIRMLKEELASSAQQKPDTAEVAQAIKKLHAEYELQKKEAMLDITNYKSQVQAKEEKLRAEYKSRVKSMQRELDEAKTSFAAALAKIESSKNKEREVQSTTEKELDKLKKQHSLDLQEVTQQLNEAIAEHTIVKDDLQEEIELLKEQHSIQLTSLEVSYQEKIDMLEKKQEEERQLALESVATNAQEELNTTKSTFISKIENLSNELEKSNAREIELENALIQSRELHQEAKKNLEDLQDRITHERAAREAIEGSASSATQQVLQLEHKLREQTLLADVRIKELRAEMASATTRLKTLSQTHSKTNKSYEAQVLANEGLQSQVEELQKSLESTASEREKVQSELSQLQDHFSSLQSSSLASTTLLETEKKRLLTEVQDSKTLVQNLQLQLEELDISSKEEKKLLTQTHAKALEGLAANHQQELETRESKHAKNLGDLQSKHNEMKEKLENDMVKLKELHQNEIDNIDSTRGAAMAKLHADLVETREKLKSATATIATKEADIARKEKLHSQAEEEIQMFKSELEKHTKSMETLKQQGKEVEQRLHDDIARLSKQHEEKLKVTMGQYEDTINQVKEELQHGHQLTIQSMEQKLQDAKVEIQAHGAKKVNSLLQQLKDKDVEIEKIKETHQGELNALTDRFSGAQVTFSKQLKDIQTELQRKLDQKDLDFKNATTNLIREKDSQLRDAVNAVEKDKAEQIAALQEKSSSELSSLRVELLTAKTTELENLRKQLVHEATTQRALLLADHQRALTDQLEKLTSERDKQVEIMSERHQAAVSKLNTEIGTLRCELQTTNSELATLRQTFEESKENYNQQIENLNQQRSEESNNHKAQVDAMNLSHSRTISQLNTKHSAQIAELTQRAEQERASLQEQIRSLNDTIVYWEDRYEHREPREEDVKMINKLTRKLEKMENKATKIQDDMAFYKNELVNREQSYNKMFANSPNVGVMQVLSTGPPFGGNQQPYGGKSEKKKKKKKKKKDRGGVEFPPLHSRPDVDEDDDDYDVRDDDETKSVELRRPQKQIHNGNNMRRRLTID